MSAGLTQAQVAKELRITAVTLWRKTMGISDFTRYELDLLKKLLNLTDELFSAIFFAQEVTVK